MVGWVADLLAGISSDVPGFDMTERPRALKSPQCHVIDRLGNGPGQTMLIDVRIIDRIRKDMKSTDTCPVWCVEVKIPYFVGYSEGTNNQHISLSRAAAPARTGAHAQSPIVPDDRNWTVQETRYQ
jgi:hypothetical protein